MRILAVMENTRREIRLVILLIVCIVNGLVVRANDKQQFDWGAARFVPVDIEVADGKIILYSEGQQVDFSGDLFKLDAVGRVNAEWSKKEGDFITLFLAVSASAESRLNKVTWFSGVWEDGVEKVVHATALMDNTVFLRKNGISFFLSLDFPYSRIDSSGIHYPPGVMLHEGRTYNAHTLSIGACNLSGEMIGAFDRAEIEAVSTYIEKRFTSRFQRPMVLSASITNQMTDVRDNRIFYSMYDNPTIALSPELVEEDLRLNAELGIEYYQVFEGVFDWPDEDLTGNNMRSLQRAARSLGVKMGDYAVPQGLYCPHYNHHHRALDRPDWLIRDVGGNTGPECLGVNEYVDMLTSRLVAHNKKYGLQIICLDFLNIRSCYADNHNHPVGDTYQQILGLVNMMGALNELDENFLVWSNSGNWIELMPKLIWYNPNVYLTDPHVREYAPHLNILKNLGDGRREQMVTVHEQYFVPYTAFTNYEYYLAPNSRLADPHVFEYSFLQGLAVTPNIGLGEIRSFLDRIPSKDNLRVKSFIKYWLEFVREHYDVWRYTSRLGDPPGPGAAEVYGHMKEDRGFLCFVNQNAFPVNKKLVLDGTMGLSSGTSFVLSEIYPNRAPIIEQPIPFARMGDTIEFTLEPYSVRIVEVAPRETAPTEPTVYGITPLRIDEIAGGYRFALTVRQGIGKEIAVVLPEGKKVTDVFAVQKQTVPMYTFPVSAKIIDKQGAIARIRIQGPREAAPTALTQWRVNGDPLYRTFPSAEREGFLGAYVHNAFSEDYEVWLTVKTDNITAAGPTTPVFYRKTTLQTNEAADAASVTGEASYQTQFTLPFIERYGQDRNQQDDAIVELGFSNPAAVVIKEVKLNGAQVPIKTFANAKNPTHKTHYIELKGNVVPGAVMLELVVEYVDTKKNVKHVN